MQLSAVCRQNHRVYGQTVAGNSMKSARQDKTHCIRAVPVDPVKFRSYLPPRRTNKGKILKGEKQVLLDGSDKRTLLACDVIFFQRPLTLHFCGSCVFLAILFLNT